LNEKLNSITDELDSVKEDKKELESEFDELAQEKFNLEKKHTKTVRKVKELERQKIARDVRTDFCSRKVKILKDAKNNYYLSSDDKKRYRKLKLVRVYEFVSGINMRLDVRNWMAERFNRRMEAVPEFSEEEFPVVEAYLESKNPKRIIVYE
jgi:predicted nuclease with TOPRIM domain